MKRILKIAFSLKSFFGNIHLRVYVKRNSLKHLFQVLIHNLNQLAEIQHISLYQTQKQTIVFAAAG
jgi:hypothetical protein